MRALAAIGPIVFVLFLVWSCAALDAPQPFGRVLKPTAVNLDLPLPEIVRGGVLHVSGQTRPRAFVQASVDSGTPSVAQADQSGRFDIALDLGALGSHLVRIDVRYRSAGDPPEETTIAQVTRTSDAIPPPRLLAVRPTTVRDAYQVMVATTPGLTIVASGATVVTPPRDRDTARGRPVFVLRLDPAGTSVTLRAADGTGGVSEPTAPIDIVALARDGVAQEPADRTETSVTYRIGRGGVSRIQTVVLDPHRAELEDLVEGRQDMLDFLDEVAGRHGLTTSRLARCVVSQSGSGEPTIEIGDRATVTLVDEFPDFIANTNGLDDRPVVSLCFPQGLPIIGDDGHLQIRVTDYTVIATDPQPTTIAIEPSDTGPPEQVYGWDRIPPAGSIKLTLAIDAATTFGLIPKARLGDLITEPALASLTSTVFYAIVQGAGLLLLLWLTASRATREHLGPTQRRAVSHVLILGVAFALLPAVAEITNRYGYDAFDWVRRTFGLTPVLADLPAAPGELGDWLLTIGFGVVGAAVAWLFRRDRPLVSGVGTAVALAAVLSLAITVSGRVVMAIAEGRGVPPEDLPRLAAWIVGSVLVGSTVVFTWWRFEELRLRPRAPNLARTVAIVGWGAAAVLLLAFPAGRRLPAQGAVGGPVILYDSIIGSFIQLLAYGYALVGVAAVILLVRSSWYRTRWERIVLPSNAPTSADPQSGSGATPDGAPNESVEILLRRLGRVIFAGYVIGTAGVFAVLPIPFLIAFPLFDRVLLRRPSDTRHLARDASSIRLNRTDLLEARIPGSEGPAGAGPSGAASPPDATEATPAATGAVAPSAEVELVAVRAASLPAAWIRNVAALGPRWPIWNDIVLGLQIGAVLSAGLVILYLTQYPFTTVTTSDPYYLQRLGLNVAAFVGSWVILGFFFGLMYANLRGESGCARVSGWAR